MLLPPKRAPLPTIISLCHAAILLIALGQNGGAQQPVPAGNGQLEMPPALFDGGVDPLGRTYWLNGQPARNGKLILTASNGFFDHGTCRASGESSLPKMGDEHLIKPNFAVLDQWTKPRGHLRWHVWLSKPGNIRLRVNLAVSEQQAGSKLTFSIAGISKTVTTTKSLPTKSSTDTTSFPQTPQPWDLEFQVTEPGEHTLSISADRIHQPKLGVGALHTIDLFGSAITEAQLLRARWRPAAVHGAYSSSKIQRSRMWVMTTRSTCDFDSYSPITTPFGYYGTSFGADRRSKGNFNFSMWAAGARGTVPPLKQMPHLLAAGSPQAEFSGFGHEGSGVKLREWIPMPDRPKLCVQALRVESDESYDTYYGYFWDHGIRSWKLYAVGRKWNHHKPRDHLSPGSFCEIPGPPHVQRSGDRIREVRRRGWHYGSDGNWYSMDTFEYKSKEPSNKFWYATSDGEFAMGTGGMRYYQFKPPATFQAQKPLPEFLTSHATRQLFEMPVEIDDIHANMITSTSARINLSMVRSGTNAKATVYFGEIDCLTFAKRELHGTERNSTVSQSTQAGNRSWSNRTKSLKLSNGTNQLTLHGLQPATDYFYRVLITNEEGKCWSLQTHSFRTK